jgi:hypothetical protein
VVTCSNNLGTWNAFFFQFLSYMNNIIGSHRFSS